MQWPCPISQGNNDARIKDFCQSRRANNRSSVLGFLGSRRFFRNMSNRRLRNNDDDDDEPLPLLWWSLPPPRGAP